MCGGNATKKALIKGAFFVAFFGYASNFQGILPRTISKNLQIIHLPPFFWLSPRAVFLYSIPNYTTYL